MKHALAAVLPLALLTAACADSAAGSGSPSDSGSAGGTGGSGVAGDGAATGGAAPGDASALPGDGPSPDQRSPVDGATGPFLDQGPRSDTPLPGPDAALSADGGPLADGTATDAAPPIPDVASAPPPPDPGADGPVGVVDQSIQLRLPDDRSLATHVYAPALDGPRPVVLFFHGFQLSGEDYASWGRRYASHGFLAIVPSMGDGILNPLSHVQLAADVTAIVDWTLANLPAADPDRIGAAGHSRGGKQVIYAAIQDARLRAVFGVDPVDAAGPIPDPVNYPSVTPEMMAGFSVPGAFLGAGRAGQGAFPGAPACAPEADNYRAYFTEARAPAYQYLIHEAGHLDFPDGCGLLCLTCVAGEDAAFSRGFAQQTSTAFFKLFLEGDERYRPWVEGEPVAAVADRVELLRREP